MALGKNLSTGRSDAAQSAIMKRVRKPRFVDNSVKHAVYTQTSSKRQVAKPVQSDFAPAHDRRYTLVEQEDTIELVHKQTDSHRYTGSLFHSDDSLSAGDSPPALLVNADNASQALTMSQIEAATKGTRFILPNLKGKSLSDLGFDGTEVQITQKASVGLRASDLAARIGDNQTSSLNSVEISRSRGSGTFVAKDFNGVDGVTAMRFVSRHDGHRLVTDRFGNLSYQHQLQSNKMHYLTGQMVTDGKSSTKSKSLPNSVTVRGKVRANNDDNTVVVGDLNAQKNGIIEVPGGIFAPTAVSRASAKAIGQRFLSSAANATGSITLNKVVRSSSLQPAEKVRYQAHGDDDIYHVLQARHHLIEKMTDFKIGSLDSGIEDLLQRFQQGDIVSLDEVGDEHSRQIETKEFSASARFKISTKWDLGNTIVDSAGFLIGHGTRSIIGGNASEAQAKQVALLKIQNPKRQETITRRG